MLLEGCRKDSDIFFLLLISKSIQVALGADVMQRVKHRRQYTNLNKIRYKAKVVTTLSR